MKLLTFSILVALVFGTSLSSFSQGAMKNPDHKVAIQQFKIGDRMPDVLLEMYGFSRENSKISDFRGKALILDFWATWCRPCVNDMPFLDSLQKKYNNDIDIVLVTKEKRGTVDKFFKQVSGSISTQLPSIVNDSLLYAYFNVSILPQQVWVDKNGYIQAITSIEFLNDSNLKSLVNGTPVNVPVKKGFRQRASIKYDKPLFLQSNSELNENLVLQYSLLTKFNDQLRSAAGGKEAWSAPKTKLLFTNMPPVSLYNIAYAPIMGNSFAGIGSKVIVESKDSLKYRYPSGITNAEAQKWNFDNCYCYDIMVQLKDTAKIFEIMREDLNRYFPLSPVIEFRDQDCLIIASSDNSISQIKTKGGKTNREFGQYFVKYENLPVSQLITDLQILYDNKLIILNKLKNIGNIDIELKGNLGDYKTLRQVLGEKGIIVEKKVEKVKVLVLKDRI